MRGPGGRISSLEFVDENNQGERVKTLHTLKLGDVARYTYGPNLLYGLFGWPGSQAKLAAKIFWGIGFVLGGFILRPLIAALKTVLELPLTWFFVLLKTIAAYALKQESGFARFLGGVFAFPAAIFAVLQVIVRTLFSPIEAIKEAFAAGSKMRDAAFGVFLAALRFILAAALMTFAMVFAVPMVIGVIAQVPGGIAPAVTFLEWLASAWKLGASPVVDFLAGLVGHVMPIITSSSLGSILLYGSAILAGKFGIDLVKTLTEPARASSVQEVVDDAASGLTTTQSSGSSAQLSRLAGAEGGASGMRAVEPSLNAGTTTVLFSPTSSPRTSRGEPIVGNDTLALAPSAS